MSDSFPSPIRGFLIDLDGVIYIDDDVIPGAAESIQYLKENHIPCRFLTNTTIQSLGNLYKKVQRLHLPIEKDEIISPPAAAVRYLRKQKNPSCHLVIMEETREDFAEFRETDDHPDYVVIGKIGDRWNYSLMNQLFSMLVEGASLIALHKDRCTMKKTGLHIEFGAFVAGLEYASGKQAYVVGKPSPAFFQSALDDMGLAPEEVVMIGDDILSDVSGAQNVGMRGFLVQTGKYNKDWAKSSSIQPDQIIPSIAEIPNLLEA
ncbi:MAG: TIGR01458 family HAD-type hydrolase [Candidatus Omnitrophica bacterium]|nr:TIGR01458 family HAD-type hydrolase [Candidatus Omnitrophota bacterium]